MSKGDLVILKISFYELEIVDDWGVGLIVNTAPDYNTVSVYWPKKGMERVFSNKVVEVICLV
tara:strand:+ start:124 stop:309 length:186 start_codon:yes stop_codon:yes gene_type:complete